MLRKLFVFMLVLSLVLGMLAGCSSPADEEASEETTEESSVEENEEAATEEEDEVAVEVQKDIAIALNSDITSLDPQGHNDTKSEAVSFLVFNRLFRLNTDFEYVPDLAESWEQPSDTEWVIKIKEGVMFHNGNEMTSEDVKFSLERSMEQPKVEHVLAEVESIEVVDDYTVKITTKTAFAPFLYSLVHAGASILPKEYVESADEFKNPIGSGPYTFVEWVSGDRVVVEKNPNYFDEENMGQSEMITFRVIPEGASRTIALETGEVDVVQELATMYRNKFEAADDLRLYEKASTRVDFFAMNNEKEPYNNQKVRQALNYAIDKNAIMIVAIEGAGEEAKSVLAPSMLGYKAADYEYDVDKAKELLAEAGYPDGFSTTITTSGDDRKRIAQIIQGNLMEVGITADIDMLEWGTFIDMAMEGGHETLILGWTSNPDPDATLTPLYYSDSIGGFNFSRINDPKVDELIVAAREELDLEKRKATYNEFHEYVMDQAPIVPLFVKNNVVGANAGLKGIELSPQGLWNIEKIHY
jgi:peptide/nickel transport system substrate-binding protein